MLGRAERALIEREPDLPGLGLVLDGERFGERLAELLPDEDVRVARAVYLRYKPRTSCLVAYRVLCRDGELDVHAVARASHAPEKLDKARARARRREPPPRLFVLDDHAVVVAVFPEDNELRVLARLAEPEARRGLIGDLLGVHAGGDLVRLRYKPERRWVGRLAAPEGPTVVLKAYASAGFEAALRGSVGWQDQPPLRVPRLLGALPEHRVAALEWIAGRPLGSALLGGEAGPGEVALAGEALARVHGQPTRDLLVRTPREQADHVLSVAAALGFVQPALSARADRLGREVSQRLAVRPPGAMPVHGDFHAGQVLLANGAAALIDFDEAALAEPAADLASFRADLERQACAGRLPPGRAEALAQALLEGYARRAAPPPDGELALHTAAALFGIAPHFFRDRDPEWPERTAAVLDRIESLLRGRTALAARTAGAERLRMIARVFDPFGAVADERIPFLPAALDPSVVQERFRRLPELEARVPGLLVRSVRVLRHKPGRRCLIEYELAGPDPTAEPVFVLGKVRARGADLRTHGLARRLMECGFGPQSADGVSIPPPLGVVPELGMWLQARVRGRPSTVLLAGSDGARVSVRLAEALHKLHRAPVSPGRTHTTSDEIAVLRGRLQVMAGERPEWAARLNRVAEACARAASGVEAPAPSLIHRDFYPDQAVVDGERVHIVDLDLCSGGDPALDVGNFVGHVIEQALREHGDPGVFDAPAAALVNRYAERAGRAVAATATVYATLTLARLLGLSVRFPERVATAAALLDLCEQRLGLGARPRSARDLGDRSTECPVG